MIAATGTGSEPVADYIPDLEVSALNQEIDPTTFDTSNLTTKANYHIQGRYSIEIFKCIILLYMQNSNGIFK